jgi:hypothetical protein
MAIWTIWKRPLMAAADDDDAYFEIDVLGDDEEALRAYEEAVDDHGDDHDVLLTKNDVPEKEHVIPRVVGCTPRTLRGEDWDKLVDLWATADPATKERIEQELARRERNEQHS